MKTKAIYAMLLMNEVVPTLVPRIRIAEMIRRARKRRASIRWSNHSVLIADLKAFFFPLQSQSVVA